MKGFPVNDLIVPAYAVSGICTWSLVSCLTVTGILLSPGFVELGEDDR